MQVRVLYFGVLKESLSLSSEVLSLNAGATVAELRALYRVRVGEKMAHAMAIAVNQEYAAETLPLPDGAEVALLPPVSGGR